MPLAQMWWKDLMLTRCLILQLKRRESLTISEAECAASATRADEFDVIPTTALPIVIVKFLARPSHVTMRA